MRPWRLTRRARVEMESELARIRGRIDRVPGRVDRLRDMESVEDAALLLLPGVGEAFLWPEVEGRIFPREQEVRTLRARVALALRAALRADEDARCEDAARAELRDLVDALDKSDGPRNAAICHAWKALADWGMR